MSVASSSWRQRVVARWPWLIYRWIGLVTLGLAVTVCAPPSGQKACKSDGQCELREFCEPQTHLCQPGCRDDTRCAAGESCWNEKCGKIVCGPRATPPTLAEMPCYHDPSGALKQSEYQQGACRHGQQRCNNNGQRWGPCYGEIGPVNEICDGVDNDCNGTIDDVSSKKDCRCHPGDWQICDTSPAGTQHASSQNVSICRKGLQFCAKDGRWGACLGQILPHQPAASFQSCVDLDTDCNGTIDDNPTCLCKKGEPPRSCYLGPSGTQGVGACTAGTQSCGCIATEEKLCDDSKSNATLWRWSSCAAMKLPTPEEIEGCNGVDDNCDGKIDNSTQDPSQPLFRLCYPEEQKGCKLVEGRYECKGICQPGRQICQDQLWSLCQQAITPQAEICKNGQDDDCDGIIDNGCSP